MAGAAATLTLPLWGCGGGVDLPNVGAQAAPTAISKEGIQFQTQPNAHALTVTDVRGVKRQYGGIGTGAGKLNYPVDVAVLNGLAYVVETGNHRVQIFNASGQSVGTLGEGTLLYPGGVITGPDEILVSDSRNARIVGFTPEGRITRVIGSGLLSAPRGLALVSDGLLVADPGLRKVMKLAADGSLKSEFGSDWVLPWDVATDGKSVFVADVSFSGIVVVSTQGSRIATIPLATAPTYLSYRNETLYYV